MMLSITSVLALFTLLAIASAMYFIARRIKIPYTVLLVLVGLLIVPLTKLPGIETIFGFLDDMQLTPELLFYIFLPVLIFESAFNMNMRRMVESAWTITLLAIVGLIVSASLIAGGLYLLLPGLGLEVPFIVLLLFSAIISSTDPVAVLALFKEYGAPKRLTLIFEGESLFNDGTAVALFLVVLAVAQDGFHGTSTVVEGITMFAVMVIAGIVLGIVMAMLFSRALRATRSNEFVTVTLMIVSAHIVFILGELINEHGLFGLPIHVSSIIATTISALFLGNYARHALSPRSDQYIAKSIEHLAFVANSLVFILAGILFASARINLADLWVPMLVTILVVATARAISVFAVTRPLNALKLDTIPPNWERLLAWGSLRGALAIIVVLLVPENFTPDGWNQPYSPRDFLLALTVGCILATLFVKALTIGPLIKRLRISRPEPLERAFQLDIAIYYLLTEKYRFSQQHSRGFISKDHYKQLASQVEAKLVKALARREKLVATHGANVFEQSLRLVAIGVEERYLKELYVEQEISETVYRRIKGKLTLQREKIEHAQHEAIDPSVYTDRKDVFDRLVLFIQTFLDRSYDETVPVVERLQRYRAQAIISRKALKILDQMQTQYAQPTFIESVYDKVAATYVRYLEQNQHSVHRLLDEHPRALAATTADLSVSSLHASGEKALHFLHERGIIDEALAEKIEQQYAITHP